MEASGQPAAKPYLYVCHGDEKGVPFHPCGRVQAALKAKGIAYDKEVAAQGSPIPFLRKGSRDDLEAKTGSKKLPAMRLPDGRVLTHSREILAWIKQQP
jgi:glutathione S-transferase